MWDLNYKHLHILFTMQVALFRVVWAVRFLSKQGHYTTEPHFHSEARQLCTHTTIKWFIQSIKFYLRFPDLSYSKKLPLSDVPLTKDKYWSIVAYNQSKLCNLLFSMELNHFAFVYCLYVCCCLCFFLQGFNHFHAIQL